MLLACQTFLKTRGHVNSVMFLGNALPYILTTVADGVGYKTLERGPYFLGDVKIRNSHYQYLRVEPEAGASRHVMRVRPSIRGVQNTVQWGTRLKSPSEQGRVGALISEPLVSPFKGDFMLRYPGNFRF